MTGIFQDRIRYSDSFLRGIESDFCASFSYPKNKLKIKRQPASGGNPQPTFYCDFDHIYDGDSTRPYTRNYMEPGGRHQEWNVALVKRTGASKASVWVGCRLRFDLGAESYLLTSVSLLFLACMKELFPLIRAEWDYRGIESETSIQHGQPHWHMLTALQESANARYSEIEQSPIAFVPNELSNAHAESIHLAMATDWHDASGRTHLRNITEENAIKNWIKQTTVYSIDQIYYAMQRSIRSELKVSSAPVVFQVVSP